MIQTTAAIEGARRKVKRAGGLLREAARELAQATDDNQPYGIMRIDGDEQLSGVIELIRLATATHGAVDVVVIPHHSRKAAKEIHRVNESQARA